LWAIIGRLSRTVVVDKKSGQHRVTATHIDLVSELHSALASRKQTAVRVTCDLARKYNHMLRIRLACPRTFSTNQQHFNKRDKTMRLVCRSHAGSVCVSRSSPGICGRGLLLLFSVLRSRVLSTRFIRHAHMLVVSDAVANVKGISVSDIGRFG
jgi:hypothetical protein